MSRVEEDREVERAEAARLATKKAAEKQEGNRIFSRNMAAVQTQSRRGSAQQQNTKQQRQNSAAQALMSRRGIGNRDYAAQLMRDGEGSLKRKRGGEATDDSRRSALMQSQLAQAQRLEQQTAPVDSAQPQDRRESDSKDEAKSGTQRGETRREAAVSSGQMPFQAVGGVLGRATAAGSSAVPDHVAKMLQSIVANVRVGVMTSKFKREGFIQISLKDSVLHGAVLNLRSVDGGVALGIQSVNDADSRLLRSLTTGRELRDHLAAKNIVLKRLDVNDTEVRL